ncbi:UNVERIFIED_CONTAM: hypothetical protein H355_006816, partial [Colinus virginianus]
MLTVCVVACPYRYPDCARRELVTLLCFLSLDRALRCQPLPDLWHLLHCLLEGVHGWKEQLSEHHHSLLAIARLLPDITPRERELRRRLSLCAMAQLLGKAPCTVLSLGAQEELLVLAQLLAQSWPHRLQLPTQHRALQDPDQEVGAAIPGENKISWEAPLEKKAECIQKGKNNQTDCFNYVRFLQSYNSSHLYACGTYAFQPKCAYIELSGFTLDQVAFEDGKGKCPYDPTKGHTGLIVDGELYSATFNNFLGTEPVILRNLGPHYSMKTEYLTSWLN